MAHVRSMGIPLKEVEKAFQLLHAPLLDNLLLEPLL